MKFAHDQKINSDCRELHLRDEMNLKSLQVDRVAASALIFEVLQELVITDR